MLNEAPRHEDVSGGGGDDFLSSMQFALFLAWCSVKYRIRLQSVVIS
jgi:hypothetical protein